MPMRMVYWSRPNPCAEVTTHLRQASLLAALCLMLAAWPATAAAEISETLRFKYYAAEHRPGTTLLAALNAASPIRHEGKVFHAYAGWTVNWQFRWWEESDGRCRLTENHTRLAVEITLPKLSSTEAAARTSFDRYLVALRAHEMEHVRIARNAAERIDRSILQLPAMASCKALEAAANSLGQRLLREAAAEEKRMDQLTDHGSRQGAILPP